MKQIEWVYNQLQSLSPKTLVQIIDELECDIPENEYKEMATDVYRKAKSGSRITDKQKRVLVNIIGQPPRI
jgi:DNA-binding PadR family transcriptional regulator